jgi:hypothetical protein
MREIAATAANRIPVLTGGECIVTGAFGSARYSCSRQSQFTFSAATWRGFLATSRDSGHRRQLGKKESAHFPIILGTISRRLSTRLVCLDLPNQLRASADANTPKVRLQIPQRKVQHELSLWVSIVAQIYALIFGRISIKEKTVLPPNFPARRIHGRMYTFAIRVVRNRIIAISH